MEELKKIWSRQKEFNDNFFKPEDSHLKDKQLQTKEMILHLISEADEVLREINWKLHRKDQIQEIRRDKIKEEIVDVFKYWLTIAQIWEITPEEFLEEFDRKSEVVEQKHKQEFLLNLLEDKNVVGVDIDGVLCDYPRDFIRFVETETGMDLSNIELKEYNLYDLLGDVVGVEEMKRLKHEFRVQGKKRDLTVVAGAKEGLKFLKEKGFTIVLLTARPYKQYPRVFADTMEWLKKNDLVYDAILWDENKLERTTREFPNIQFMIEDHHINANNIGYKGHKAYLITTSYNKDKVLNENVKRVSGWKEIMEDLI